MLSENVKPSRYNIRIEPDLKTFAFSGVESIDLSIEKSVSKITLNSKGLKITRAYAKFGQITQEAKLSLREEKEEIDFIFAGKFRGDATLFIEFSGKASDNLMGLYKSRYTHRGKEGYILTTQFEPTDARTAFPCFDEPMMKAEFALSLLIDKNLDAVSNTPMESTTALGNKKMVKFIRTPRMASYLLYIGVGKFEHMEDKLGDLPIRFVSTPGKKKLGKLAIECAKSTIDFLQKYTGIKYPMPKVDLISIPDFAVGAMENWGAVTFNENLVLAGPDSSVAAKFRVLEVVAHELVHQYFGDLVTMKWWHDLWLNESFATFMSYKILMSTYPEFEPRAFFFNMERDPALIADGRMQTHPIHQRVHDPAEIASLFDSISYEKGANVIAMIEDFVGQDYFRESISRYLNRYSLSNASEKDLWRSMEEVLRRHGKAMKIYETMSSWLKRPGYPVVYVTKKKRFKLTQKRFVLAGDRREKPWPIPLSFFVTRGKVNVMFDGQSTHIVDNSDWIKLNYNETGFYRTMYSPELLQKLGHLISTGKLGAFDAWGVENDLFALLRSGRTGFDAYFDFVSKHLITTEQPLATSVVSHMAWIAMMYEANGRLGMISKNLTDAFLPLFLRLGWTKKSGENVLDSVLRANLVLLLGILGERSVLEKANSILEAFLRSGKIADMSVLGAAFQIVPYGYGGKTLMAKLKKLYKKADLPEIRLFALKALGMFKEKDALKKALAFAISKEVPLKDFLYLPTYVAINPHGRELFWPFVHSNWSRFFSSLTPGSLILRKLLEGLDFVSDDKTLKTVTKFFSESKNMRGDLDLGVRSSLETIKANIAFVKKNLTD